MKIIQSISKIQYRFNRKRNRIQFTKIPSHGEELLAMVSTILF